MDKTTAQRIVRETFKAPFDKKRDRNFINETCRLDRRKYPTGRKVSNDQMKSLNLKRSRFHGEWNYVIQPRDPK